MRNSKLDMKPETSESKINLIVFTTICSLDALQKMKIIIRENAFEQQKKNQIKILIPG